MCSQLDSSKFHRGGRKCMLWGITTEKTTASIFLTSYLLIMHPTKDILSMIWWWIDQTLLFTESLADEINTAYRYNGINMTLVQDKKPNLFGRRWFSMASGMEASDNLQTVGHLNACINSFEIRARKSVSLPVQPQSWLETSPSPAYQSHVSHGGRQVYSCLLRWKSESELSLVDVSLSWAVR